LSYFLSAYHSLYIPCIEETTYKFLSNGQFDDEDSFDDLLAEFEQEVYTDTDAIVNESVISNFTAEVEAKLPISEIEFPDDFSSSEFDSTVQESSPPSSSDEISTRDLMVSLYSLSKRIIKPILFDAKRRGLDPLILSTKRKIAAVVMKIIASAPQCDTRIARIDEWESDDSEEYVDGVRDEREFKDNKHYDLSFVDCDEEGSVL
jgi:hypothetical protein